MDRPSHVELDPQCALPVLEVLRRAVRERQPVVDCFCSPAVKDFLTFHRVTLPLSEDRQGVWQVIQGMHLALNLESMGLQPSRGRADQLWCRHPAGHFFEGLERWQYAGVLNILTSVRAYPAPLTQALVLLAVEYRGLRGRISYT